MTLLLQISDPHFGTEQPQVEEALVQLAHQQCPELLVLSGDITQRAEPEQFAAARRFCDRLRVPSMLAIPGNHDIPLFNLYARLRNPYGNFIREFGADLEPQFCSPQLLVVCVNTTRAHRHKNGEVSTAQIRRVGQLLSGAELKQLRIVVTHQPVHVLRERDEHDLLRGNEAAVRAWSAAGADLILGGHIHLPYVRPLSERFSGLARAIWCVQAGTSLSSRVRHEAANSVNLIRYQADAQQPHCYVERWDFSATMRSFVRSDICSVPLDRR